MKIEISQNDYDEILTLIYQEAGRSRATSAMACQKWERIAKQFSSGIIKEDNLKKTKIMET